MLESMRPRTTRRGTGVVELYKQRVPVSTRYDGLYEGEYLTWEEVKIFHNQILSSKLEKTQRIRTIYLLKFLGSTRGQRRLFITDTNTQN
jgi:hypothetical protein